MEEELERELTSRSLNPLNTSKYIAVYVSSLVGGHYLSMRESMGKLETCWCSPR
jgi:hypothetical protein